MTGVAKNTVTKLLVDLGKACAEYQDGAYAEPDVQADRVRRDLVVLLRQAEERSRRARRARSATATSGRGPRIDADTKLDPVAGSSASARSADCLRLHRATLRPGSAHRIQLTHRRPQALPRAVVDAPLARRHRLRACSSRSTATTRQPRQRRYSPAQCNGTEQASSHRRAPIRTHLNSATSSARTSRCGWGCGGSPA